VILGDSWSSSRLSCRGGPVRQPGAAFGAEFDAQCGQVPPPDIEQRREFVLAARTLHIDDTGVTCALNLRSHHPALIDAGFAELQTPIP
jgi:hypothetical protein